MFLTIYVYSNPIKVQTCYRGLWQSLVQIPCLSVLQRKRYGRPYLKRYVPLALEVFIAPTLQQETIPQSSSRTHLSSGLVLMVGPKGGGKSALLKTFKPGNDETEEAADTDLKFHAILDYSYFDATDSTGFVETRADREDAQVRVSVWSCSELVSFFFIALEI